MSFFVKNSKFLSKYLFEIIQNLYNVNGSDRMQENGFHLVIDNVSEQVRIGHRTKTILSNLSLSIERGEFIAIVGCSGAGKTTLMNILSGYSKPSRGNVYIEGLNLLEEEYYFKGRIAYVPQEEILDQTLTLYKSLEYSLKLRMKGISKKESKKTIQHILKILELSHVKNTMIKNLSGGEKKRASIATEMLSDPNLFLLDEPTSGLDANIEKKIMRKLREIADTGKTIIITAHTVSNLNLCDKVLFMGTNGRICYYGPYKDIFKYFGVEEFVDIYDLLKEDSLSWYKKYKENQKKIELPEPMEKEKNERVGFFSQTITLVKRYLSSLINNKFMLILLLGQALLMAFLICVAVEKEGFLNPVTSSMMCVAFTLASMWLGLFNTIQEIVKERDMLKKEYMSGLNFASYIVSKIIVVAFLCLYQAITCVSIVYFHLSPRPEDALLFHTLSELIINFFLVAFSTSIIGLFISSLVKETKTTLILSPLYMMIQMLFSGMFVPFIEITKNISYFTSGRWGFESFGTISNLTKYGVMEPTKNFFKFSEAHILSIWLITVLVSLLFLVLSIYAIRLNILSKKNDTLILDEEKFKVKKKKINPIFGRRKRLLQNEE